MIASRRTKPCSHWCRKPGLPTASVVRSSQATPARRRGQGLHHVLPEPLAFGAAFYAMPDT